MASLSQLSDLTVLTAGASAMVSASSSLALLGALEVPTLAVGSAADVEAYLRAARSSLGVAAGSVREEHLASSALAQSHLDPAAAPLPASRGGTGLGSAASGALLLATGGSTVPGLTYDANRQSLRVAAGSVLQVGGAALWSGTDWLGRRTIFAAGAGGAHRVNLLSPADSAP